jgi:hypothetical protein
MNLKTIKDLTTPKLEGITFEWIKEDGYPRELRLNDAKGQHVIIRTSDYGSLRILVEAPEDEKPV